MTIKKNPIVSDEELDQVLKEMTEKAQNGADTSLNPYDVYINDRKRQKRDENTYLEKHHILPRHENGPDKPSNLVLLTIKEHVIAHWLRWKVLGKTADLRAFLFRIGDSEQAQSLRAKAVLEARERDKQNNQGFYDREAQRARGLKGGPIGGSANTQAQYEARQKVGRNQGRNTGIGNQKEELKEFVSKFVLWGYSRNQATKPRDDTRDDEEYFYTSPKKAFADIARVLNSYIHDSIRHPASMHKVIYGERKQMYGWRIVFTLTRSEASAGIQEFFEENPTAIVNFEFETD